MSSGGTRIKISGIYEVKRTSAHLDVYWRGLWIGWADLAGVVRFARKPEDHESVAFCAKVAIAGGTMPEEAMG